MAASRKSSRERLRGFSNWAGSRSVKSRSNTSALGRLAPSSVQTTPGAGSMARNTPAAPPASSTPCPSTRANSRLRTSGLVIRWEIGSHDRFGGCPETRRKTPTSVAA